MIELKNVTKRFGDFTAVEDVSFTVDIGSVFGLIGYNGAGKTTLLKCIAGIYKTDGGEALIGGQNAFDNNTNRHKTFFVPDEIFRANNASMSSMAKFYRGYYPDFNTDTFDKIVKLFELDPKKKLRGFSKGMLRQAEIAFAFSARPRNMLLDEVFDGLDPAKRHLVKKLFLEYTAETNCSIIISSHNLQEIGEICDKVGLLDGKRLKLCIDVNDIPVRYKKFSVIFENEPDISAFDFVDKKDVKITGRLAEITAMGNAEEAEAKLRAMAPSDIKSVPMTMEEVFLHEMEDKSNEISNIF